MNKSAALFAVVLGCCLGNAHAAPPKLGAAVDGGVFLLREEVEIYWNDWIAYPLMARKALPTDGDARLTIIGDGKTATFIGNLGINCENGKHRWESAGSGSAFVSREEEVDELVPSAVIKNAVKLFCKKR